MPADKPAPDTDAASSTRSRTVAASTRPSRTSAPVGVADGAAATPAPRKRPPAKSVAKPAGKPSISPSPGAGEGTVLTAVATEDSAVAVIDAGAEGLSLDEAVVAGPDGAVATDAPAAEETAEGGTDFEWDDEEESEALRQARKDAELTA
ncbi:MAG TPA: RNA polymerase sigma factor, partial [Geodermatophilus sp.]|nr:RNA polymerase sigma factor [Geodermatophilus sp.]